MKDKFFAQIAENQIVAQGQIVAEQGAGFYQCTIFGSPNVTVVMSVPNMQNLIMFDTAEDMKTWVETSEGKKPAAKKKPARRKPAAKKPAGIPVGKK